LQSVNTEVVTEKEKSVEAKVKQKKEKRKPNVFYKPFVWNAPVFEKYLDKRGREKVKVKTHGYFQLTYVPGTKIASGERIYEVQPSGALKCINKVLSKRAKHRAGVH
jgi:hypothetical protein